MEFLFRGLILYFCLNSAVSTPTQQAASAEFRLVVLGWRCRNATIDHCLQVDGKGDEVWIVINLLLFGANESVAVRTPTMGDANDQPGRLVAGSRSDRGGIQSGDVNLPTGPTLPVPADGWNADSRPTLPFAAWQGTLVEGKAGVPVEVGIVEDDRQGGDTWRSFLSLLGQPAVQTALQNAAKELSPENGGNGVVIASLAGLPDALAKVFGVAGDRFIEAPRAMVLTYDSAMQMSGNDGGVVTLEFDDRRQQNGNVGCYEVLLRIERVVH